MSASDTCSTQAGCGLRSVSERLLQETKASNVLSQTHSKSCRFTSGVCKNTVFSVLFCSLLICPATAALPELQADGPPGPKGPLGGLSHSRCRCLGSSQSRHVLRTLRAAISSGCTFLNAGVPLGLFRALWGGGLPPPFEVVTDASGFGLGAVLMQQGHPVAFESRTMNPAERNYPTGEQELLAVVHAMRTWRPYLEGVRCTVVTDHKPNTFLLTQASELSRRKARWQEYLSRFDIEWVYKPGKTNVADPLSRMPTLMLGAIQTRRRRVDSAPETTEPAKLSTDESNILLSEFREGYAVDPWFADETNMAKLIWRGGLLLHPGGRICVPDHNGLRRRVIREAHDPPHSGHFGRQKTQEVVQRDFWWPRLGTDVEQYVRTCQSCQRNKPENRKPGGLLQPLPVPDYNWQSISVGFIVQLPMTKQGHDAIIVFVIAYQRWCTLLHATLT